MRCSGCRGEVCGECFGCIDPQGGCGACFCGNCPDCGMATYKHATCYDCGECISGDASGTHTCPEPDDDEGDL